MGAPTSAGIGIVQPTLSFSIPAGPLSAALAAFGETTRLQILYPAALAQGVGSRGVNGTYTAQEALQRLLAKTGLGYRFTNAQTITIERQTAAGAAGPMSLPWEGRDSDYGVASPEGCGQPWSLMMPTSPRSRFMSHGWR